MARNIGFTEKILPIGWRDIFADIDRIYTNSKLSNVRAKHLAKNCQDLATSLNILANILSIQTFGAKFCF